MARLITLTLLVLLITIPSFADKVDGVIWKSPKVSSNNKLCTFSFSLEQKPVTHIGDADIIASDVGKRDFKEVLLSIESIDGEENILSKPIHLKVEDFLPSHKDLSVELPCQSKTRVLGVFLCSNASRSNSCTEKPGAQMNSLLPNSYPLKDQSDVVYYFSLIAFRDGKIGYVENISKQRYAKVRSLLSTDLGLSDATTSKIVTYVETINDRVASLPLKIRGNEIIIPLTRTIYTINGQKVVGSFK